ncbi:hypothetical protein D3C84_1205150 [compost metagenome]
MLRPIEELMAKPYGVEAVIHFLHAAFLCQLSAGVPHLHVTFEQLCHVGFQLRSGIELPAQGGQIVLGAALDDHPLLALIHTQL